jgi:beta-glucosidase
VHDGTGQRRRPDQELVAFAKVHLEPGESTTVTLELDERAFAAWDAAASCWTVDAGTYEVRVGPSSRDVRGELVLDVTDRA